MEGFPSLAALVELPALSAPVTIRTAFGFLLKALGAPKDTPRASLPYAIPATAAVSLLQLLSTNLPEDVSLQEVAAAMSPAGVRSYPTDQQVQLDALLGLSCLLSSGSMQDKLQLCFWALDKDSSGSLDLEQLLGLIPGAHLVSCAARILLQEATLQGLVEEVDDPRAAALTQQASAVLREVLTRAFLEADPHGTGLIQPGEQLMQLLFAAAAQLTSILVGAAPSLQEGVPGGFGSSYASSTSTTPSRSTSASPLRLQQAADRQQQQQQQLLGQQSPQSQTGRAPSQQQQQQQQHPAAMPAVDPGGSSSSVPPGTSASPEPLRGPMADVVIMDSEGGVLHYQTSVEEAAAAACQGRTPNGAAGGSGIGSAGGRGVTLYAPPHASSVVGGAAEASTPRQRLAPATSLLQHLELLEAQQQLQQQQQQVAAATTSDSEAGLFLTPGGTASAEEGAAAGAAAHGSPFGQHMQHPHEDQQHLEQQHGSLLHRPQLRAGLSSLHLSGGKSTPGSSANNSLRRIFVGSPFGTISESVKTGGISSGDGAGTKEPADNTADAAGNAAPATAAGAITHTATNVMTTIQSNVIAVVVKLLLHCGLCFLVTTMVVLGDAALVTGLHIGAKLPLSVSFAVAVAANLALVLLLVVLLVVVRHANASNNSRLAEVANSPEAQQLDQILETMKAAVQALKTTEQQQQQQQQQVGLPGPNAGSGSNRFTGSHFLASRASSIRGDLEQGRQQGGAGGLARAPSGPLAVAGKLRAVWSAVGKVAGFLPAAQGSEDALAGPFGSAVQLEGGAAGQHSSTSWGVSSGPEGLSPPAGAGRAEPPGQGRATAASAGQPAVAGQAVRPGQQQSRQTRVAGSAAPPAAPGAPPVALKEAYPQL